MCVVAVGLGVHPEWPLLVAGNRDEYHARASEPLDIWRDNADILAGRDLVSGGTWMGVSQSGRFAVVTNIRDPEGPDPNKQSRGALVADWLADAIRPDNLDGFNPFNLIVGSMGEAEYFANRPSPVRWSLDMGIKLFSNAPDGEPWPRKDRLQRAFAAWLENGAAHPDQIFDLLADETDDVPAMERIFIRNPVYGTRCSTLIAVRRNRTGYISERRFDAQGDAAGEIRLAFSWPTTA
jgi:uncharacterized protein with NRDE domain